MLHIEDSKKPNSLALCVMHTIDQRYPSTHTVEVVYGTTSKISQTIWIGNPTDTRTVCIAHGLRFHVVFTGGVAFATTTPD